MGKKGRRVVDSATGRTYSDIKPLVNVNTSTKLLCGAP